METQLTWSQVLFAVILQGVGFLIYYLRTRTAAAKRDADLNASLAKQKADNEEALRQQEAALKQRIADSEAESERRMTEAALIREQGHREEQQARAEIERQLIASHNRFADEIRANREASGELFGKLTDVLDHMSKRQEVAVQTHNRNGEKIDVLSLQIKAGFDKTDLLGGEQITKLTNAYNHIDDAAQRVIAAVADGNVQVAGKLATFDPVAATVTAIATDVSEVVRNVRELQTAYAAAIPKILESLTANATMATRFDAVMTLVETIGTKVNTTEGSVVKIEEHIQAIQREMSLRQAEPALTEEDTAELKPLNLPDSGDVPTQGTE